MIDGYSEVVLPRPSGINGLVLSAGLSSRMGQFKPLLPFAGKTVIESAIDSMLSGGVDTVVVVLGHRAEQVRVRLRLRYPPERVSTVVNPHYAETDMFESIRVGLGVMPPCRAFYLLPGDMPLVSSQTYRALAAAFPTGDDRIVFPLLDGHRAHPPLIGSALIEPILRYEGRAGLRGFWSTQTEKICAVPVLDTGCVQDLDTPQQYQCCLEQLSK